MSSFGTKDQLHVTGELGTVNNQEPHMLCCGQAQRTCLGVACQGSERALVPTVFLDVGDWTLILLSIK